MTNDHIVKCKPFKNSKQEHVYKELVVTNRENLPISGKSTQSEENLHNK